MFLRKFFFSNWALFLILSVCFLCSGCSSDETEDPEELVQEVAVTTEEAEVWSEAVKGELAELGELLLDAELEVFEGRVATVDFEADLQKELRSEGAIRVREIAFSDEEVSVPMSEFCHQLRALLCVGEGDGDSLKFKVYRLQVEGENLITRQLLTAGGSRKEKVVRSQAVVDARWTLPDDDSRPRLVGFMMPRLVQSEFASEADRGFNDITSAVLGGNEAWSGQLAVGMNDWAGRIDHSLKPDFLGYHGVAIGDVDGDGLEDVYLCQPGGLPNLLFRQNDDGTLSDISSDWDVGWLDNSTSALLVDLDNDGDKDLALATQSAFLILENEGAKFTLRIQLKDLGSGYSPSASDYDLDGDLDLLVLRYGAESREVGDFPTPHPFHDARNGGANVLLKNEGGFRFANANGESGLSEGNYRFSFAAVWEDYDNDGDADLYIANDFGPNQLYRNESGKLIDGSVASSTQDWGFGMSAAWGDYDRDGDMDLYVSSMFSGAGNLVVPQRDFNPNMPGQTRERYLKMVRGNSLMRNDGGGEFSDVTSQMDEGYAGWAWGSVFGDFDNDGWEDLYVANGYISQPRKDDL